jgi:hypothetical protein
MSKYHELIMPGREYPLCYVTKTKCLLKGPHSRAFRRALYYTIERIQYLLEHKWDYPEDVMGDVFIFRREQTKWSLQTVELNLSELLRVKQLLADSFSDSIDCENLGEDVWHRFLRPLSELPPEHPVSDPLVRFVNGTDRLDRLFGHYSGPIEWPVTIREQ